MNTLLKLKFLLLSYFLLCLIGNSQAGEINYPEVSSQVSFKAVTELPVKQPDHKIAYGDEELQYGLLWLPITQDAKPLIILVHGGCWLNAYGVDHVYPMATALTQAGYPVWALEYRRSGDPGGGWPGSFMDIKQGLTKSHLLNRYGVDSNKVILMGHSAGGHLALLAATELTDVEFSDMIGLAAITDISRYSLGDNSCQQATKKFMSGLPNEQSQAYQSANLIYRTLPENMLLLQGDADNIVPMLQSQLYDTPRQVVKKAGHFDWIHPGTPAFQTLLQVLNH